MSRKLICPIGHAGIRNLIFAAFALLAVMPVLMLIHMGLLSRTYSIDLLRDRNQMGLLFLFLAGCYSIGLFLLIAISRQVIRAKAISDQIKEQAIPAIEAVFPADGLDLPDAHYPQSDNELEAITETLAKFQTDISRLINQVKPQACILREIRQILEHLDEVIIIVDGNLGVSFCNRVAREHLGMVPERNVRQAIAESRLAADSQTRLLSLIMGDNEPRERRTAVSTADGETFLFEHFVREVEIDGQRCMRLLVLRDISAVSRLERQLYRTEKLASLGQLISGVAHELNNPLAAVLGFAELCRNSKLPHAELDGNLEIIEREARRTARIVENLLNFSRRRSSSRAVCDIHTLLERCFVLLHYQFKVNGIKVLRDYSSDVPSLLADESQVQQVFMNLLANGCQALIQATVSNPQLHVATRLSADGQKTIVEIADNGIGIPEELANQVFEPFFTTKGEDQGTGLGLPISKKIMQEHGGDITIQPADGEFKTSFHIHFPMSIASGHWVADDMGESWRPTCRGHILVADAEEAVLLAAKAALEQIGLTVDTATSITEVKTALVTQDYDAAIVDSHLPDGGADELLTFIDRSIPAMSRRIILISADPALENHSGGDREKDRPVVVKPFHLKELYRIVRSVLAAGQAGARHLPKVTEGQ